MSAKEIKLPQQAPPSLVSAPLDSEELIESTDLGSIKEFLNPYPL